MAFSQVQVQKGLVYGFVLDKNEQIIDYANVLLLSNDSTLIEGALVNQQGAYSIKIIPGKYILHVKAIGFKDIFQHINIPMDSLECTFYMTMDKIALDEIVMTSKTPLVRREADKLIFEAGSIAPGSSNALDILRNVPGVIVTNDEIKILGQQGVKILINEKEQKMSEKELLILLKSYQAEQVDKIEVMTTPSSKFDAEGSAGVLNIKLKKNRIDYMSTTLNYTYSYNKHHINDANANFIYNKDKMSISLNSYGTLGKSRYKETNQEEYELYNRKSSSEAIYNNGTYNLRGNMDYKISKNATVGVLTTYNKNRSKNNLDGKSGFYSKTESMLDSLLLSENPNKVTNESSRISAYSDLKIDTLGKKILFNIDYLYSRYNVEKTFLSKTYDSNINYIGGDYGFNNDNGRRINAIISSVDMMLPFKNYTFNWGAKVSLTKTKNKIDYYNWTSLGDQSNDFYFKENIYALYAEFSKTLSQKLTLKSGLRLEHTYTVGKDEEMEIENSQQNQNNDKYTQLFPTLYLGYKPHEGHQFNFSLSSRISRPSFRNINPFILYTSKYSTVSGKPDLKPAYTYKINLGYTLKGNFSIDGFYSYKVNSFAQVQKADIPNLTVNTFWDNVLNIHTAGINNSYLFNKVRWMQIFIIQGINYEKSRSKSLYTIPVKSSLLYIAMINASFFFNKEKTFTGWLNSSYSSPEKLATVDLRSSYNLNIGSQYSLLDSKLKIALSLNNIISSHVKGNINSNDFKMSFDNQYSYPTVKLSITYIIGAKLSGKRYNNTEIQDRM